MVIGHFDLSHIDFNYLENISTKPLNFNIYHLEDKELETFKREWKQSGDLLIQIHPALKTMMKVHHLWVRILKTLIQLKRPQLHPPISLMKEKTEIFFV